MPVLAVGMPILATQVLAREAGLIGVDDERR